MFQPADAQRDIYRTVSRLASDFRPQLRIASEIADGFIRDPVIDRAGTAHPRLPMVEMRRRRPGRPQSRRARLLAASA